MSRRGIERVLWVLAALAGVAGWARWSAAAPRPAAPPPAALSPPAEVAGSPGRAVLGQAVRVIAANDVFRLDRSPAPIAFAAAGGGYPGEPPQPPPPPKFRPPLAVSGIVGPPWQAFLEGVPGRSGSVVVERGDVLEGGLRIRSIGPDLVIVQGADTTWRLTPRKPWQ